MVDLKTRLIDAMRAKGHDPDARGSTAWLAARLGISHHAAAKLLDGRSKSMGTATAAEAVRAFGGSLAYWLLEDQSATPANTLQPTPAPSPTPPSLAETLEALGIAIAAAPADSREALAVNLAGWARAGGQGPWAGTLLQLLQAGSQATPGKRAGTR